MWRLNASSFESSFLFLTSCVSARALSCSSLSLSGKNFFNPAHSNPLYITRKAKGHIKPKPVEMKEGYGCVLCKNGLDNFKYKDVLVLHQFISPEGHLLNKRVTGVCKRMQRRLAINIKRARLMGYLPKKPQTVQESK